MGSDRLLPTRESVHPTPMVLGGLLLATGQPLPPPPLQVCPTPRNPPSSWVGPGGVPGGGPSPPPLPLPHPGKAWAEEAGRYWLQRALRLAVPYTTEVVAS